MQDQKARYEARFETSVHQKNDLNIVTKFGRIQLAENIFMYETIYLSIYLIGELPVMAAGRGKPNS